MNLQDRSRRLRREADDVLARLNLHELCAAIGPLTPTGSYFMDLMIYPDIDLYLPSTTPERFMGIATQLATLDGIRRINYMRGGPGPQEDGLYLGPKFTYGNWGRPWKLDIWAVSASFRAAKEAELSDLKVRMTPAQRDRILQTKFRLLTDEGRTPVFSGIFIYRAVIDHQLEDHREIVEFLRANDISVPAADINP